MVLAATIIMVWQALDFYKVYSMFLNDLKVPRCIDIKQRNKITEWTSTKKHLSFYNIFSSVFESLN